MFTELTNNVFISLWMESLQNYKTFQISVQLQAVALLSAGGLALTTQPNPGERRADRADPPNRVAPVRNGLCRASDAGVARPAVALESMVQVLRLPASASASAAAC
jgi:hypothetical protein